MNIDCCRSRFCQDLLRFFVFKYKAADEMEEIAGILQDNSQCNLGRFIEQLSLEKEKSYHEEKSLQRILFQGVERYVIILMYLWLARRKEFL